MTSHDSDDVTRLKVTQCVRVPELPLSPPQSVGQLGTPERRSACDREQLQSGTRPGGRGCEPRDFIVQFMCTVYTTL